MMKWNLYGDKKCGVAQKVNKSVKSAESRLSHNTAGEAREKEKEFQWKVLPGKSAKGRKISSSLFMELN